MIGEKLTENVSIKLETKVNVVLVGHTQLLSFSLIEFVLSPKEK
jgi:hypothetical protein